MPDISATRPTAGAPIDTPWGQQVHDMLEGIQAGSVNVTASAGAGLTAVTFPRAYTSPPIVLATCAVASFYVAQVTAITTTGFSAAIKDTRDTGGAATQAVNWLAIGNPA